MRDAIYSFINQFSMTDLKLYGIQLFKVIGVVFLAFIALRAGKVIIRKFFLQNTRFLEERRVQTLVTLLQSLLVYLVYFIGGITILTIFGLPTTSILASAGIIGLAVGFGAQNLVRDVITGFFIIFEDQFAVGEYIETAGLGGIVEEMGLRVTKLRDWSGVLHIIPNGEITKVTNHNRGSLRALVDVGIAYEEDISRALKVMEEVSAQAKEDLPQIVDGPHVLGVVDLGESEVVLRVIAQTKPMEQWLVERELRKRIKEAFDRHGIEIPYPRRVFLEGAFQKKTTGTN